MKTLKPIKDRTNLIKHLQTLESDLKPVLKLQAEASSLHLKPKTLKPEILEELL